MKSQKPIRDASFVCQAISKVHAGWNSLLHKHTIFVVTIMFVIGVLGVLWHVAALQSDLVASTALQNASVYSQALAEFRTLYTSEVMETVRGIEGTKLGQGLFHFGARSEVALLSEKFRQMIRNLTHLL